MSDEVVAAPASHVEARGLDRLFGVSARGSTLGREVIAGLTTFGAMSYIVVVNPAILSAAGMDRHELIITTAIASIIGTLIMALWANLPIALAPGMGSNVIFAQVVVLQMGVSYQTAFTMVLIGGILFLILSLTRIREQIVLGFPAAIRLGIQCGIGLFIAYLGLKNGGLLVVQNNSVHFGNLADPATMLTFIGVLVTPVLVAMRVPAAFLISIVLLTIAGFFLTGLNGKPVTPIPDHIVNLPVIPKELFFAFDFHEFISHFFLVLPITLYFFISDFFSATATLIGVTRRGNMMTPEGQIPNARQAFIADGLASVIGAMVGTSTVAAYIESATGVEAGGRTGLTGIVVAILFGLSLFIWPLIAIIPAQATAPALVLVGVLMMEGIRDLDVTRPENALPPIMTLLITVCTTDLMMGLTVGCFVYTLIVLATRQWQKVTPWLLGLDAIFIIYMILTHHMH
ncbi:putative MFS transporter, AGZA family, xanthine/uracil permease [Faunimonas pinastri]|uniref:Putative MFS transporter, AGZA family, xanthine/uracil permease n=1 Tax=Faunimonas pinastri TaxID=1855383 RepID=A0A1H9Q539_9HYPH|nr:NCS2 family permease [Faunimonas pinastri]SER55554.1 putative MFS transporter, AGZA family, xanthine/uracil permease [Faunimonas pinastri]